MITCQVVFLEQIKERSRNTVVFRGDGRPEGVKNTDQPSGDLDIALTALLFKGGVVAKQETNKLPVDPIPSLHVTVHPKTEE